MIPADRRALLDAALGYTEQSPQFKIIPVDPVTKRPLIKTGTDHVEGASTDPAMIRRWFQRWPDCGIAVVTGEASGVIVIDCDKKHDGEALLRLLESERVLGPLPRLRAVRTRSGGLHLYLAHPGGIRVLSGAGPRSPLGRLLGRRAGVDVRADGGIAVLPPSLGYSWIADDDGPFPPIPPMWLAAIQGEGKPPPRPRRPPIPHDGVDAVGAIVDDIIARHGAIVDGARNDTLYKLGVRLRHADASDGRILDELERINGALVMPPLSEREVQTIARSAARGNR